MKQKLKTAKGITLIALVITIIIMLILVAVTVTIAINGGLFGTAKGATKDTEIQVDRETLQAGMVPIWTAGGLNLDELRNNLPAGWNVEVNSEKTEATCTSPKGNVFTVYKEGTFGIPEKDQLLYPDEIPSREGMKIGDYVNYVPDGLKTETGNAENSKYTYPKAAKEAVTYTALASSTGHSEDQVFNLSDYRDLKWRVFDINEETGEIKLMAEKSIQPGGYFRYTIADGVFTDETKGFFLRRSKWIF